MSNCIAGVRFWHLARRRLSAWRTLIYLLSSIGYRVILIKGFSLNGRQCNTASIQPRRKEHKKQREPHIASYTFLAFSFVLVTLYGSSGELEEIEENCMAYEVLVVFRISLYKWTWYMMRDEENLQGGNDIQVTFGYGQEITSSAINYTNKILQSRRRYLHVLMYVEITSSSGLELEDW